MAPPARPASKLLRAVDLVQKHGTLTAAAKAAGVPRGTLLQDYRAAKKALLAPIPHGVALEQALVARLRSAPLTVEELQSVTGAKPKDIERALANAVKRGVNAYQFGDKWSLERLVQPGATKLAPYKSQKDGTYLFGWISDAHLCSKYARLDVLADLYRKFADLGVERVFNAGNWIDGEARFNKFDLLVHGMDRQVQYAVDHYPVIQGIKTYAVTGDDHEGWYAQREGVDIGRVMEGAMKDAGRTDWVNLGYMEAYVPLQHAKTGKTAMLHVAHPGGGSAYATSYTMQKLVEGYESGNKPAVLLAGHYHKLEFINIRGVWVVQTGCTQDLTPFARKKKLRYEIGGGIMRLAQNPETGAIEQCGVDMFVYFDKGYYENQRWSHHGDVVLPARRSA